MNLLRGEVVKKLAIIGIVVVLLVGLFCSWRIIKMNIAIQRAKEYVAEKYDFASVYLRTRYSWIEPSIYYVSFTAEVDGVQLIYFVMVQDDLSISPERSFDGDYYEADNYIYRKFELDAEAYYARTRKSFKNVKNYQVTAFNTALYAYATPLEARQDTSLENLLRVMNYNMFVTIDKAEDKKAEAEIIFEVFQELKELQFNPKSIYISYGDSDTTVCFSEWQAAGTNEIYSKLIAQVTQ